MAWKSWLNLTINDYMDILFMDQVAQNIVHVKDLIFEHLHRTAEYLPIDTSEGYHTQPLPDYLNIVERNLDNLEKQIPWFVKRQPGRTWLGEYNDNPTFRYSDVNRWFSDLLVMKLALDSIPAGWRKSGTFSCGNNYLLQMIRRR